MVTFSPYHDCCGIAIMHRFPESIFNIVSRPSTMSIWEGPTANMIAEANNWIKDRILKELALITKNRGLSGDSVYNYGLVIVSINKEQEWFEPALEELGFKCVQTFVNPKTENQVKIFHLVITKKY